MSGHKNQKACRSCGNLIPLTASLCTHCDTYQDWRRHISIGNSTLALLIALLALIGPATEKVWSIYKEFKLEDSKRVEFSLIDLSDIGAQVLVSNRSNSTIVVKAFQCLMLLPYDKDYFFDGREDLVGNVRWPKGSETVGTVLITYKLGIPVVIEKGKQAYTEFPIFHIAPAKPNKVKPEEEATSLCSLGAINETNSLEADAALLKPGDLISFDALEIVERADYSLFQEEDRQALLAEIRRVRHEASQAREEQKLP